MLVLYIGDYHFSGWSMRGRVAVAEKGLPVVERLVELDWPTTENDDGILVVDSVAEREAAFGCQCDGADLLRLDSEGVLSNSIATLLPRVPILVDTDTEVIATDVIAIGQYLDDIAPDSGPRLLGASAGARARILSVCGWATHDLSPFIEGAPYALSLRADPGTAPQAAIEQARWVGDTVGGLLARFGGPFVVGEFSLADIVLSTCFQQIAGWGLPVEDRAVADYGARLLARASVLAHLDRAREIYRAIEDAEPGSPNWVVRHYRYHRQERLLHDWQRNRCQRLLNAISASAVEMAYDGLGTDAIARELAATHRVPLARVHADVRALFAHLAPV